MIEHLSGTLIDKNPTKAIISAAGVGYATLISLATFESLPNVGEPASLFTHLAVREDALTLYGFATVAERDAFLLLTSVTGVGSRIAIGILSGMGIEALKEYIARADAGALVRLPGVGRKLAERLILELRDKIGAIDSGAAGYVTQTVGVRDEALTALVVLGYNRTAAEKAIRAALKSGGDVEESVEALIKGALRQLG